MTYTSVTELRPYHDVQRTSAKEQRRADMRAHTLRLLVCVLGVIGYLSGGAPQSVHAQSRAHSNWIFGAGCTLSWDADNHITTGTNDVLDTFEGVATFSRCLPIF